MELSGRHSYGVLGSLEFVGFPRFTVDGFVVGGVPVDGFPVGGFAVGGFTAGGFPVGGCAVDGFPVAEFPVAGFAVAGVPVAEFAVAGFMPDAAVVVEFGLAFMRVAFRVSYSAAALASSVSCSMTNHESPIEGGKREHEGCYAQRGAECEAGLRLAKPSYHN